MYLLSKTLIDLATLKYYNLKYYSFLNPVPASVRISIQEQRFLLFLLYLRFKLVINILVSDYLFVYVPSFRYLLNLYFQVL